MNKKEVISLILGKFNKENELSWAEINQKAGLNFSDDHVRKMGYGVKYYDEYLIEEGLKNASPVDLSKMNEKLIEIKKNRQQLSDERAYTSKKLRALARAEDFIEKLKDELELLSFSKPFKIENNINKTTEETIDEQAAVLLLSDIHYGIDTENELNIYNPDIAYDKMVTLCSETLDILKKNNIKKLYILELGDSLSGNIHNSIRIENRIGVTRQIAGVSELISNLLFEMCSSLDEVVFSMVEGNHDRIFPNKDENLNDDSFNILIQELIKQRTRDIENLTFLETSGNSYSQLNICGNNCMAVHGDKDKPNSVVGNMFQITGTKPDYVFMGHYHKPEEYMEGNTEIIINGSFSGGDSYSFNIRKNTSATQKLMLFNNTGRICTYNLKI